MEINKESDKNICFNIMGEITKDESEILQLTKKYVKSGGDVNKVIAYLAMDKEEKSIEPEEYVYKWRYIAMWVVILGSIFILIFSSPVSRGFILRVLNINVEEINTKAASNAIENIGLRPLKFNLNTDQVSFSDCEFRLKYETAILYYVYNDAKITLRISDDKKSAQNARSTVSEDYISNDGMEFKIYKAFADEDSASYIIHFEGGGSYYQIYGVINNASLVELLESIVIE